MRILMRTPSYIDSGCCSIADGLLSLGHEVYNTKGKLNYGEAGYEGEYDYYLMCDTDDLEGLKFNADVGVRIALHLHDRWSDYLYAPDSPIKPVPEASCDLMFVRDLDTTVAGKRTYPTLSFDFAIERRYMDACDKFRDVVRENKIVFWGTLTTARRNFYLDTLVNAGLNAQYGRYEFNEPDDYWSEWIYGRYTHDENYYRALCRSMFVLVPYGAGPSTMRMPESYAAGCIPVIQRYPADIVPLWNFVDEENCLLWSNEEELVKKVSYYMNHVDDARQLRERCYRYGQENLLSKHLAEYILREIKKCEN